MIIPIGTDSPLDRRPLANYALIVLNLLVFLGLDSLGSAALTPLKDRLTLHADEPRLFEFVAYQFLHGDGLHLFFNMLFLWVFGNSVNARMGHVAYVLFYLAGGVFAGLGYAWLNVHSLLGASGSIAAVTMAYLVLFPRTNVSIIYWFLFIGHLEIPSMIIILLKIVLWDNIIGPALDREATNVAYSAHLAGYLFGFWISLLMLWLRALPRSPFDILSLVWRAYQRHSLTQALRSPASQARVRYGRMARTDAPVEPHIKPQAPEQLDQADALKVRISQALARNDRSGAVELYQQFVEVAPRQVLSRQQQLDIANQLMTDQHYVLAAGAYEAFLRHYADTPDAEQVHLLLGIVYARYLEQYTAAEPHFRRALERLRDPRQRQQCHEWLSEVRDVLGGDAD